MDAVEALKKVLANNFALYLKAQYYHWNVEGPDFAQFHHFFGDFYEEVYSAIDHLAEEIRALNSYAPGSFQRFIELADIEGEERILDAPAMLNQLARDNQLMIISLTSAYYAAEEIKALGLANFLQDRLDAHNKHAWMIRSFLKGR
jgi:starvation-inducible DNA-binding protein